MGPPNSEHIGGDCSQTASAAHRPQPLVPFDCSLQDFPFMPMDVQRVLKSDTWVLATGDERAAAVSLWLESWHQIPAGSLPNNDRILAHLSLSRNWNKVKSHALRGWLLCSDGRYYHPVVAEKALEAWIEKLLAAIAGANGNSKRWGVAIDVSASLDRLKTCINMLQALAPRSKALKKKAVLAALAGITPGSIPDDPPTAHASGGDRNGQRKGQGKGEGIIKSASGEADEKLPTAQEQVFAVGIALLTAAGVTESNARSFLAAQVKAHTASKVLEVLHKCAVECAIQPIPWIVAALAVRTRGSTQMNRQQDLEVRNREVALQWAEGA